MIRARGDSPGVIEPRIHMSNLNNIRQKSFSTVDKGVRWWIVINTYLPMIYMALVIPISIIQASLYGGDDVGTYAMAKIIIGIFFVGFTWLLTGGPIAGSIGSTIGFFVWLGMTQ